ncbi:cell wall-active antibiotics response protein LiaF [Evansella sp. AB-P1]|uniref:cell wall-active antibiotics response protein LiaF n=1 Tax=Evansella sp. AB-P1 TaxID=3037653 RepID=UPI00241EF07B|nr:cell wall-active antibiotics response protein LiaF [Evansella sp. AB-P1]MDG5786875.1 cell wall-active antibiotics response protein LiaF [Evansella sp. AB-P1]
MFRRLSTDTLNWIILIGIALLFIELFFFNTGLVFTLFFFTFLTYIGIKSYTKTLGKVFFWIGAIFLFLTIVNLIAIRFLAIAAIVLFFVHYRRTKENPERIEPAFVEEKEGTKKEPIKRVDTLFKNRFLGSQKTKEIPYHWRDVNIHGGFGDRIIDLSNTVLPDESVISIRHFIGNIKIYVPYEVEVSVVHSSIYGRVTVFQHEHASLLNQTFSYHTENYGESGTKVKIVTSILSGDIEVKRI